MAVARSVFGKNFASSVRCFCGFSVLPRRCASTDGTLRPRRSLLYIPGNDERKIKKASSLNADIVVLDCEDGVALNRKKEARDIISNVLNTTSFGSSEVAVRINSVDSEKLALEDMNTFMQGLTIPTTLLVPKVEHVKHLEWINEKIFPVAKSLEPDVKISLIIFIESAIGLLNLREILEAGVDPTNLFNLEAVVFGSDDFFANIGATRTKDAKELMFARQSIVIHCKAFGLQAIDMVHIGFKDLERLEEESIEGAKMGFTGKQVIHPSQVDIVNKAFSPSPEKIEWAKELVGAFEQQSSEGIGAITFRGQMIDMPLVKQAFNVLKLAKAITK
ncbi:citramalyl-CoA lyase, mitochondrial-like [Dendronephthya gigantea]|uniref:citramalyl-CoA lyase, mitochondrial-like n=1 Tax=Dendronephthya gigantea TaxID=151771 RepID=UPI0010697E0F|nr:citramalyl-CoA lyase, mitochondrial-like [Dendronephthya gigantea]